MGLAHAVVRGALAGAVGTAALDAATYLDMAVRGRPASSTPQDTVARIADRLHVPLPADAEKREARLSGAGGFLGLAAGTSAGAAVGALRAVGAGRGPAATGGLAWAVAMLVGNAPMTLLGVTDPRRWSATDWAADVVPHLAYAAAFTGALHALEAAAPQPWGPTRR